MGFILFYIKYIYLVVRVVLWTERSHDIALIDVITTVELDYFSQKFCHLYLTVLVMIILRSCISIGREMFPYYCLLKFHCQAIYTYILKKYLKITYLQ